MIANKTRPHFIDIRRRPCYTCAMTDYELMRLSETVDEDAFEREDFPAPKKSDKQAYDEFYDDVKQPSRYIKEDW